VAPAGKKECSEKEVIWGEFNERTSHKGVGRVKRNNSDGVAAPPLLCPEVGGGEAVARCGEH